RLWTGAHQKPAHECVGEPARSNRWIIFEFLALEMKGGTGSQRGENFGRDDHVLYICSGISFDFFDYLWIRCAGSLNKTLYFVYVELNDAFFSCFFLIGLHQPVDGPA